VKVRLEFSSGWISPIRGSPANLPYPNGFSYGSTLAQLFSMLSLTRMLHSDLDYRPLIVFPPPHRTWNFFSSA